MPGLESIRVYQIFGSDYAVIAQEQASGSSAPFPVLLSAVTAAPTYGPRIADLYRKTLIEARSAHAENDDLPSTQQPTVVTGYRIGTDAMTGLPIYDLISHDSLSVSEIALERGYGAISESRITNHLYPTRLFDAMRHGREEKTGMWHEWNAASWSTSIPFTLMAKTKPVDVVLPTSALSWLSIPFILVLLGFLAFRDATHRGAPRPWWAKFGGGIIGYYGRGSYHTVPMNEMKEVVQSLLRPETPPTAPPVADKADKAAI